MSTDIYIATVGLDRNRWGSREPSFSVSEWLPRFEADGFDGVELWEFHYLRAGKEEQHKLEAEAAPLAIYNSYVGFADADAEERVAAVKAIERLNAKSLKYNLGRKAEQADEYKRNFAEWADALPADCRLLCECHEGTVLEDVDAAEAFFADLDPERFGMIIHWSGETEGPAKWISAFGPRIQHMHVQLRCPESDPSDPSTRERQMESLREVNGMGFDGSISLEFSRGIGKEEQMDAIYANTLVDLAMCREALN